MTTPPKEGKLSKQLTLFDVFAISTGAMFSSGFFLLPGIAAAGAGPSVVLAYLVAALFILPAMLSVAELSTAMPKAGGAYFFLDRSLGPLVGTVGGLGTWIALVLKSAFALVGMGAYLALFIDVPMKPLAVALTVLFMVVNIVGAKETSGLQRVLVTVLLLVLGFFIAQGLWEVFGGGAEPGRVQEQFSPFLPFGINGLMATVGLVFVSYAGLTKVASVAEEVQDPDRNIPLGMALSLATATAVYVLGVFVIVAVLEPGELRSDLTPVATAASAFFDWLPGSAGLILIVVAAIAAFASTGNAGIMSASRYPLAMARDRLVPDPFARIGRFGTPTLGVVATSGLMIAVIVFLDVEGLAKLASAFQLLLFGMVNLSVIVMREARIEAYDPGFHTPFYPWVQLLGVLGPLWLITELGPVPALLAVVLIGLCIAWYFYYAKKRVRRTGAIFHAFAHYGQRRDTDLDMELRGIVKAKGLREADPFDEVVARARVMEVDEPIALEALFDRAAGVLARELGVDRDRLAGEFMSEAESGFLPVARGAAMPHARIETLARPELLLVRIRDGLDYDQPLLHAQPGDRRIHAVFFLVSPESAPGQHLRLLGHLASHVDEDGFLELWLGAANEHELKETLLREERSFSFRITADQSPSLVGRKVAEAELPAGALVALVRRGRQTRVPGGGTELKEGDYLTVIGAPEVIEELADRYGREPGPSSA